MNSETTSVEVKNPELAVVSSFLDGSLGQIFIGQIGKRDWDYSFLSNFPGNGFCLEWSSHTGNPLDSR